MGTLTRRLLAVLSPGERKLLKWSVMVCCIVWTLIFQLGEDSSNLPEFVYVNF